MACPKCGDYKARGKRFCASCGSRVDGLEPAQPDAAAKGGGGTGQKSGTTPQAQKATEKSATPPKQAAASKTAAPLSSAAPKTPAKPGIPSKPAQVSKTGTTQKPAVNDKASLPADKKSLPDELVDEDLLDGLKQMSPDTDEHKKKIIQKEHLIGSLLTEIEKKDEPKIEAPAGGAVSKSTQKKNTSDIGIAYKSAIILPGKTKEYLFKSIDILKTEPAITLIWSFLFLFIATLFFSVLYLSVHLMFPPAVLYFSTLLMALIITPVMSAGFYQFCHHVSQFKDAGYQDLQMGQIYGKPLVLLGVVTGIQISVGTILLVIPGIVLFVHYIFTTLLVIDRKLEYQEATLYSIKLISKNRAGFVKFGLSLFSINLLGALLAGIGLLATLPLSAGMIYFAYDDLFGCESLDFAEDNPEIPSEE
ncbi:MAG: hypothetical protein PHW04_01645 [Candidatus Wallbacteria bacterium]|nr:hypothetical protein [Candidatus Wallbacteria bacterium]